METTKISILYHIDHTTHIKCITLKMNAGIYIQNSPHRMPLNLSTHLLCNVYDPPVICVYLRSPTEYKIHICLFLIGTYYWLRVYFR